MCNLITTQAYLPRDAMAHTLAETTRWPDRRKLVQLGQTRADLGAQQIAAILEATADAISAWRTRQLRYFAERQSSRQ